MTFKYRDGKVKRWEKLSKDDQADLLYDLLSGFSQLKSLEDSAAFITDLLTLSEVRVLSKRLRIAKLLIQSWKYEEISKRLNVSHSTIAKVAGWLLEKGAGFRKTLARIPERKKAKHWTEHSQWDKFKMSHPGYFLPGLLMESLENESIKEDNRKLKRTLDTLSSKDVIRKNIDDFYKEEVRERRNKK